MADINDFDYVDNFRCGLARVRQGNKWGIVNEDYEIVVPIKYDAIWKSYDMAMKIFLEKDGIKYWVSVEEPWYVQRSIQQRNFKRSPWEDEPGWGSYEEYGGPNGYDDFTIDAAFEGDPDAVWNID